MSSNVGLITKIELLDDKSIIIDTDEDGQSISINGGSCMSDSPHFGIESLEALGDKIPNIVEMARQDQMVYEERVKWLKNIQS